MAQPAVLVLLAMLPSLCAALTASAGTSQLRSRPLVSRAAVHRMGDEPCQDEVGIRADAEAAFRLLDADGDGEITDAEMKRYLQQFKYTDSAVEKIYQALDMDGCGVVHMEDLQDGLAEYCRCSRCEPKFVEQVHAEADAMFDLVDLNSDGSISTDELRGHLVSTGYTATASDAVFDSLDSDSDGSLSRDELRAGFLKYSMFREAVVAVVTTLVKQKRWSPGQRRQRE
mmetsp:Transcript_4335/g.7133  ORF Transcript_4335/g.7133 Transcript_4335/m.7133 type:complete len:228 (-) Transcript_4335:211-894(-)